MEFMLLEKEMMTIMNSWQQGNLEEVRVLPKGHQSQLEKVRQGTKQAYVEESIDRAGTQLGALTGAAVS